MIWVSYRHARKKGRMSSLLFNTTETAPVYLMLEMLKCLYLPLQLRVVHLAIDQHSISSVTFHGRHLLLFLVFFIGLWVMRFVSSTKIRLCISILCTLYIITPCEFFQRSLYSSIFIVQLMGIRFVFPYFQLNQLWTFLINIHAFTDCKVTNEKDKEMIQHDWKRDLT